MTAREVIGREITLLPDRKGLTLPQKADHFIEALEQTGWVVVSKFKYDRLIELEAAERYALAPEPVEEDTGNAVKPGDRWTVRMVRQGNSENVPGGIHYAVDIEADGPWSLEPGEVLVREGEQAKTALLASARGFNDEDVERALRRIVSLAGHVAFECPEEFRVALDEARAVLALRIRLASLSPTGGDQIRGEST